MARIVNYQYVSGHRVNLIKVNMYESGPVSLVP